MVRNLQRFMMRHLALLALRSALEVSHVTISSVVAREIDHRTPAMKKNVKVQQDLEQELKVPPPRSLGAAVEHAVENNLVSEIAGAEMRSTCQQANAGRHRKRPVDVSLPRGESNDFALHH